ncbi:MAG: DUF1993 family protein [Hyphomonadaceae bacterium]
MTISLYDATVPGWLQMLGGVANTLEKGAKHASEKGENANDLVNARLIDDMFALNLQIALVHAHSIGAIDGVKAGVFAPPRDKPPPADFAGMQAAIADAQTRLRELSPADVDALVGKDVVFDLGSMKLPFTAEHFLFSFSLPNFYFHATTAYDILRARGAPLGKRDFLGQMRMKAA